MTVSAAVDPDAARAAARAILDERRFRPAPEPRPLDGALRWIGDRLDDIFGPVGRFLDRVWGPVFEIFAGWLGTVVGVAVTLAVGVMVLWLLLRNRVHARLGAGSGDAVSAPIQDPKELERAADDAEHAGDYTLAVQLRYRAGLLRLGRGGAATVRPWSTNAAVARQLRSIRFDALTGTFETVTYGRRAATSADAARAAREWPVLLEEVGNR